MIKVHTILLATALAVATAVSHAHHSFSGTYQENHKIEIVGVVHEFRFFNPHVLIYVDVKNANGTTTRWVSEGSAANSHRRAGWSKDSIKKGDLVRVSGDSTRDGSPMVSLDKIEVLNPKDRMVVRVLEKPRGGAEAVVTSASLPSLPLRLADGRPNFGGAWTQGKQTIYPPVPLSAAGQAVQTNLKRENDPQMFCDPPGVVRQGGFTPHPLRFTQLKDRVIIEYEEYGGRREVFLAPHKIVSKGKSNLGDSIAHYDGDALIIETTKLLSNWSRPDGYRMSDQATTVETYRRVDDPKLGPVISMRMVVTDPVNLKEPWVLDNAKVYSEGYQFIKNDCRPPLRKRTG